MPELPEVEVCRKALAPALTGKRVTAVHAYCTNLRSPVPPLMKLIGGQKLTSLTRRSKYLVWRFEDTRTGKVTWLTTHLGMSGAWRLWPADAAPAAGPHDRLDIIFDDATLLRLTDPRKFSDIKVTDTDPRELAPLNTIGAEPFDESMTPEVFYKALRGKTTAIKQVLLSGKIVCGCGNIYACESLFEARIRPTRKASKVTKKEAERLLTAIRDVLTRSIAAGGTTLRDFHGTDGESGWFALECSVYGREGEPCPVCGSLIKRIVQNGRSSFFCPTCQK